MSPATAAGLWGAPVAAGSEARRRKVTHSGQMHRKKCVLQFHTFSGNACRNRSQAGGIFCSAGVGLLSGLAGVFDGLESREFDVVKFAVDPLDPTHIDVLHNVARLWID
jgi:hypothetical protein